LKKLFLYPSYRPSIHKNYGNKNSIPEDKSGKINVRWRRT